MNGQKTPGISATLGSRARRLLGAVAIGALIFVGTLLVYLQVCSFTLINVDDPVYVTANPQVLQGIAREGLRWSFEGVHDANWIPLTWLSLMLDTAIYGPRPAGYHLTNALLHAANAVLLFAALAIATGSRAKSGLVAALFALHPLHVESVAWVAERKDVLSIFFGLISLVAYVRYATAGHRWLPLAVGVLFFVASLMSKATLVTLPFVFLLLDYWPLGRLRLGEATNPLPVSAARRRAGAQSNRRGRAVRSHNRAADATPSDRMQPVRGLFFEKLPFFAISGAFSAIAMLAQSRGGAVQSGSGFPFGARCLNAVVVYAIYLWKTVNPLDLAVYYPYPHDTLGWFTVGPAAVLLLAISAAAVVGIRRFPYLFVGWCWYLGTLVPMIGLVQIGSQQMADRYTYFPLIGVFLAVVWLVPELTPAGPLRAVVLPAATAACVALLAATTFSQISYWHDSVTLLRHSKDCTPDNSVAHEFLGNALLEAGVTAEAVEELEAAVRMKPQYGPLHFDLAMGLEQLGQRDAAIAEYRQALSLAIDDNDPNAHNRLGAILLQRGDYDEAGRHFARALELDKNFLAARVNQALLSLKKGDYAEAIARSESTLALDPRLLILHHYVAEALRAQGHTEEAIGRLRHLVEMDPDDKLAKKELEEIRGQKSEVKGQRPGQ